MVTIRREWLDNTSALVNKTSDALQAKMLEALSRVDFDSPDWAKYVKRIALDFAQTGDRACAEIGQQLYDLVRTEVLGEASGLAANSDFNAFATAEYLAQAIDENSDTETMLNALARSLDVVCRRAAGQAAFCAGKRDKHRPRFARVPSATLNYHGHDKYTKQHGSCAFCDMLASRGPVYYSRETAGEFNHYHPGCDCRVVPFWDYERDGLRMRGKGQSVEGYDPDEYYRRYTEAEKTYDGKPRAADGHTLTSGERAEVWAKARRLIESGDTYIDFMNNAKEAEQLLADNGLDGPSQAYSILRDIAKARRDELADHK